MSLLTPTALALLALAVPILLLWMLKLRRRNVPVASTMLWQRLLRDREANAPWQRLRRNLLLLLQLAILVLLVLALARPSLPIPTVASGSLVVLLDASASMNATDVEPDRFSVAQRAAEEMVRGLRGDNTMTVIAVGDQPSVLAAATNDRTVLRDAVEAAQPECGSADWASAFALAAGAARGSAESTIVIVSDGNLPDDLPPLPGAVRYVPIGGASGADNLALTALAFGEGSFGPELFVNVSNTSLSDREPAAALLAIYLDGVLYQSRNLLVAPGQNQPLTLVGLPPETELAQARLLVEDALALDNSAWAVRPGRGGETTRVLLVTPGNLFLERAIAGLPRTESYLSTTTASDGPSLHLTGESFDLYVFDRLLPDSLPPSPMLVIDPPQDNPLIEVTGAFSNTELTQVAHHPLLDHVDLHQVQIMAAKQVVNPDWAQTLVTAQGGPLLLAGEYAGRRVAILTFDLHHSDLPLQIAFPVLMANLKGWLLPGAFFDADEGLQPGTPVTFYPGDAQGVQVTMPDETVWAAEFGQTPLVFAGTSQLGVYQAELSTGLSGRFAVNLFDPPESSLSRQETITVGRETVSPAQEAELGYRELWPWLALAALMVLVVEWWLYHRGSKLL